MPEKWVSWRGASATRISICSPEWGIAYARGLSSGFHFPAYVVLSSSVCICAIAIKSIWANVGPTSLAHSTLSVTLDQCVCYAWCFLAKSRLTNNLPTFHIWQTFSNPNFHTLHNQSSNLVHLISTSCSISLICTSIPRILSTIQSRRRISLKPNLLDVISFGTPTTNSCLSIWSSWIDITIIFMVIEISLMLVMN